MTEYTADDFKHARFATKTYEGGKQCLAVAHQSRDSDRDDRWTLDCTSVGRSDQEMAGSGFAPVQENPRPLTPDDITDEMVHRVNAGLREVGYYPRWTTVRTILRAALTPPPSRPEGAEELEALIDRASLVGEGADNESLADYLAARLLDPTVKDS